MRYMFRVRSPRAGALACPEGTRTEREQRQSREGPNTALCPAPRVSSEATAQFDPMNQNKYTV